MANLCWNFIVVQGADVEKVYDIFKTKEGTTLGYEDMAFILERHVESLLHEDLGTKWFDLDSVTFDSDILTIGGSSAWSPPIGFFQNISEKYDVNIEIDYEECGIDFGGKCLIEGGNADDHELSYMGYVMEYGDGLDNFIETIEDREYKSMEDFYEEYSDDKDFMSRLSEDDLKEIEEAIMQTINN